MRFLKILFLLIFSSCTKCAVKPAHDGAEDIQPASTEAFAVKFISDATLIKLNPAKFPTCVGFKIEFKSIYYGLFLADETIFLPVLAPGEKAKLNVTCTDKDSKDGAKSSWDISH